MTNIGVIMAAALVSLAGTEWGPEGGGQPERFITFKEKDVTGSGGCNRFGGRYDFQNGAIKIGPLISTRKACAPEVMDAEQKWFSIMEKARTADATALTLLLKDENGAVLAALRRRDND